MKKKNFYFSTLLTAVLVTAGLVLAQGVNIDPKKHPNLAEAQHHIQQATAKIDEAQNIYHDRLGGHAEKAKELLFQADREIKEAAEYADHH